jgi:DNA-damage-inducible protein J
MAMTSINVRVDARDKQLFDNFCAAVGMNMSTAINMFMKATLREQKIPFELAADPFYGESNTRWLEGILKDIENGDRGRPLATEEMEALGLEQDGPSNRRQSESGSDLLDAA